MPYPTLPPSLLDLTLLRLSTASPLKFCPVGSAIRWQKTPSWRRMYQTITTNISPGYVNHEGLLSLGKSEKRKLGQAKGLLAVRSGRSGGSPPTVHPVEELERRVQALEETVESQNGMESQQFYTEEDLMALYADVLAVSIPETPEGNGEAALEAIRHAEAKEDRRILNALQHRLLDDTPMATQQNIPLYRKILTRAQEIFTRVEAARNAVNPEGSTNYIPLALLSIREFETLVRESMKAKDFRAAEIVLDMMKRERVLLPTSAITNFLQIYAACGNTKAADDLLANFSIESPTETHRHIHIKTHLNGTPQDVIPTSALELLHHYEEQNIAAPMQTYTSVISSLFSRQSSLARAQAWDIFSHMRYAAHPDPDVVLYTLMIRACASPVSIRYSSEPEKALDLWTEMTTDHKLTPTVGSYNAVILACARSGTKMYVNEAFRLARQMLDAHRDAHGNSAFKPDRKTFCALLEGAKRIGDLGRARWILAELVREIQYDEQNITETEIDDEIMMHIFNAYASYKPPFVREATLILEGDSDNVSTIPAHKDRSDLEHDPKSSTISTQTDGASTVEAPFSTGKSLTSKNLTIEDESIGPSFSHLPPQSRAEVIREVEVLFTRILGDRRAAQSTAASSPPFSRAKFRGVEITSRLVGAYLSVYYKHADLETCAKLFWKVSGNFSQVANHRIYLEALERCGNARRGHERQIAVSFADQLWGKWVLLEDSTLYQGKPLPARNVERAHIAMIRVLTITENTDRAMDHLRQFANKYPPNAVRMPAPKPAFRSTRSALVGHRPLVRMTSAAEVPDDYVPPLITFRDVEVLHHRLIDEDKVKDIKYVTWLCKAYEWALRVRRDAAVQVKVAATDKVVDT